MRVHAHTRAAGCFEFCVRISRAEIGLDLATAPNVPCSHAFAVDVHLIAGSRVSPSRDQGDASLLEKMAMADQSAAGRPCVDVDPLEAHDDGSRIDYHRI